MKYLEALYQQYKEQKKNPIPEIEDIETDKNKLKNKFMELQQTLKENTQTKPVLEFGEIYYLISERGIPMFFMINGELEGSSQNLYSVYKVSDFVDFATEEDFIFELNGLPYMVETWNEFYIPLEEIEKAVYIGKLSDEDIDLLLKILDEGIKIPPEKRGLSILEEGYFIQNRFKEDEVEDVKEYKARIFEYFDDLEEKQSKQVIYIPPERLEKQLLAAGEEKTVYRGKNFTLFYNKEEKVLELEPDEELIDKPAVVEIFGEKHEFENFPKVIQIAIPEEFKDNINIDYIGQNIIIKEVR